MAMQHPANVEEIGYQAFLEQVRLNTGAAWPGLGLSLSMSDPIRPPQTAHSDARSVKSQSTGAGSIRSELSRMKARAELERKHMEQEHELAKVEAELEHQRKLLENDKRLAELELDLAEEEEARDTLDDVMDQLTNVPIDLDNWQPQPDRTREWAATHFAQAAESQFPPPPPSESVRKLAPTTTRRPQPKVPTHLLGTTPARGHLDLKVKQEPRRARDPVLHTLPDPSRHARQTTKLSDDDQSSTTSRSTTPAPAPPKIPPVTLSAQAPCWVPNQMGEFARTMSAITSSLKLPPLEVPTFSGEDGTFVNFMLIFEQHIEARELDERRRLQFLIQYTKGRPRDLASGCITLPAETCYQTAKTLLQERYGRPFDTAMSHLKRITKPGRIAGTDRKALLTFSDELRICAHALLGTGYLHEINSSDNLRRIVKRLPDWCLKKWLGTVAALRRRGVSPGIWEICEFVSEQAGTMNDPVFGGLLDEAREHPANSRTSKKDRDSPLTGFATGTGSPQPEGTDQLAAPPPGPEPTPTPAKCPKCRAAHTLFRCPTFKAMSVPQRREFVQVTRLCHLCLRAGHFSRDCARQDTCGIDGCTVRHARFLHLRATPPGYNPTTAATTADVEPPSPPTPPDGELFSDTSPLDPPATGQATTLATARPPRIASGAGGGRLLPIIPVRILSEAGDSEYECHALLDNGSNTTFCLDSLFDELNIPTTTESITVHTLGQTVKRAARVGQLRVAHLTEDVVLTIPRVYSETTLPVSANQADIRRALDHAKHLRGVTVPALATQDVRLIIGVDAPEALVPLEVRRGPKDSPFAIRTRLGWTVLGPIPRPLGDGLSLACDAAPDDGEHAESLDEQLAAYFNAEFADVYDPSVGLSVADKVAVRSMADSIVKVDGHYRMRLLWRDGCPMFPNNWSMATRRLASLKRKLSQNPSVHQRYTETVEGYISAGYAERLSPEKLRQLASSVRFWLLVHFVVYHRLKPDKPRVVFDCPATFQGTSLNDQLLQGPDNNNNMLGVILRFRQGLVAASGDVEAMFHQVRVHEEDRDSLCFLWWPGGDLSATPVVYRMNVFVFGAICSPSAAVFALQQCVRDNQDPTVRQSTLDAILRDFYVDDCLTSTDDVADMQRRVSELCAVLRTGGFRLTKWQTTSRAVLNSIPEAERAPVKPVSLSRHSTTGSTVTRALGLWWDVTRDVFLFQSNVEEKPVSRRSILSLICQTFDPTGCISPFVLPAKILLQDLCRLRLDWDAPVPESHAEQFKVWKDDLPLIEKIELPRCYKTSRSVTEQNLHHFSDASQAGYGGVSYLRTAYTDGTFSTSFVVGKSRVCPLKSITIPRLELSASALVARMDRTVRRELTIPLSRSVFWTDSVSTLGYIKNRDKRYHTFVANKIAHIHETSSPGQWRFVSTSLNPADLASRGITARNEDKVSLWLNGPDFLVQAEEAWPPRGDHVVDSSGPEPDPEEKRPVYGLFTAADPEPAGPASPPAASRPYVSPLHPLFTYHSNWTRLKRAVAALQRVKAVLRAPGTVDLRAPFTARSLIDAEAIIIREVQYERFAQEMDVLRHVTTDGHSRPVHRGSSIRALSPILHDGLLRVGGRLGRSDLPFATMHPFILPSDHPVTATIIRHCHETSCHSGREYVHALTRQRYWILHGNSAIRRALSRCFDCKRRTAPNLHQRMADLPPDRITADQPPFSSVGVDYFGPFYVRCRRSQVKRYGCIFTCLASRASHIEVAHSLDTDSFLNAFHRFVARRGRPTLVRSDNGTNFRSGEKELRQALKSWNQSRIATQLAEQHVQWVFNPPAASSWGGVWERTIRTIRKILAALVAEQPLTDEALSTLMCQVEEILNGRPLTPVSTDPRDVAALTPNDLLLCRPRSALPPGLFASDDNYAKRRWRQVQYLTDVFWRRWTKEYIVTLQKRARWTDPQPNIARNDLVVVQDDRAPRNHWPLGRVLEVYPGRDGLVRAARIRCKQGVVVRPCTKLCLVESAASLST